MVMAEERVKGKNRAFGKGRIYIERESHGIMPENAQVFT